MRPYKLMLPLYVYAMGPRSVDGEQGSGCVPEKRVHVLDVKRRTGDCSIGDHFLQDLVRIAVAKMGKDRTLSLGCKMEGGKDLFGCGRWKDCG